RRDTVHILLYRLCLRCEEGSFEIQVAFTFTSAAFFLCPSAVRNLVRRHRIDGETVAGTQVKLVFTVRRQDLSDLSPEFAVLEHLETKTRKAFLFVLCILDGQGAGL